MLDCCATVTDNLFRAYRAPHIYPPLFHSCSSNVGEGHSFLVSA